MLFQNDQLNDEVKNIMLYATDTNTDMKSNISIKNKKIMNVKDYLKDLTKNSQNNLNKDVDHNKNIKNINLTFLGIGTQDSESLNVENAGCSEEQIARVYKKNELVQAIMTAKVDDFRKLPDEILKKIKLSMGDFRVNRNKLYIKRRLYISNDNELKICILQQHHDPPEQRHSSYKTMFQSMQNGYFWPNIPKNYKKYAVNYDTCHRTKAHNVQKQGFSILLPISNQK